MACFNPEHAACSWRGCLIFSFFWIPEESNYKYTTNILPKKPVQCSAPIIFSSQLWRWEREGQDAKSQKLRIKVARETGLGRGSRARCVESQAKPSGTSTAAGSHRPQTGQGLTTVLHFGCVLLHLSIVPQQLLRRYPLSPCSAAHPAFPQFSAFYRYFIISTLRASPACSGVWAVRSCDLSWSCPSSCTLCQVDTECSAQTSKWHRCFATTGVCVSLAGI